MNGTHAGVGRADSMADQHDNETLGQPSLSGSPVADRQRAALRDMMALPAECAEADTDIERQYHTAKDRADGTFKRAKRRIRRRHQGLKRTADRRYQREVARIRSRFESDLSEVEAQYAKAIDRIAGKAQSAEDATNQELQNAIWMAESVLEADKASLCKAYERTREAVAVIDESADSIGRRADELLRRYRQRPIDVPPAPAGTPVEGDPGAAANQERDVARLQLTALESLWMPKFFIGLRPIVILLLFAVAAGGVAFWITRSNPQLSAQMRWQTVGIAAGVAPVLVAILGLLLRLPVRGDIAELYVPLRQAISLAHEASAMQMQAAERPRQRGLDRAEIKHEQAARHAQEKYGPVLAKVGRLRDASLRHAQEDRSKKLAMIDKRRNHDAAAADEHHRRYGEELRRRYEGYVVMAKDRHGRKTADCRDVHDSRRAALERRWGEGMSRIESLVEDTKRLSSRMLRDWDDPAWRDWTPPDEFASVVGIGQLYVDTHGIARETLDKGRFRLRVPPPFSVPALLAFPARGSLLVQTGREQREQAIRVLQMVTMRLLTSLPPGRVRLTIIDPLELGQNFSGLMHLADHDDNLVGGRIWTDSEHIEQRLTTLTQHMENVFQKYLRNEFATIDAYNVQAGDLAEPYRFLVIADFPMNFTEQAARRLSSIISSGARCGVYTLISHDVRHELPEGIRIEDIEGPCANLVYEGDRFLWKDDVFGELPLQLDPPPSEDFLTRIMHVVGNRAIEAGRVEVEFDVITPDDDQCWSGRADEELRVPVGRTGATRLQYFSFGRGVAQHGLIVGKTGSGKSTLLHVLVTNLAMWYSPDEVEFYLVDFKKGVEFKTYAVEELPHARAVAIESDREFGVSVLQRVDAEMSRRGELYRKHNVQELASYRKAAPEDPMPRTLLIVDEFQEFFAEDDKLAQDATLLLDRLVRQGRAFGIHVFLGSQSLAGAAGLARSSIGQMAVRIALQCSEADAQLVLADDNTAARLLSRPGEAVYNDAGGLIDGNSPFQVAWLPEDTRERYLSRARELADERPHGGDRMIVFEGNAPAEIEKNRQLASLLAAPDWPARSDAPRVWLGEPVTIKDATSVAFRRQSGANLIIIGQRDDSAMAMMSAAMIGLAAHHPPNGATFHVLDGTPPDSAMAGVLRGVASSLPHPTRFVGWRDVDAAMAELAEEIRRRQEADDGDSPSVYLLIHGLQRYRMLRSTEDEMSFSLGQEEQSAGPDKQFSELLREGPPLGMHVIAWCDTPIALDRALDRRALREFDHRVLFQLSAADSSNLIDSPVANKLGLYRAICYSEELGTIDKFRPYGLLEKPWLERVAAGFAGRIGTGS